MTSTLDRWDEASVAWLLPALPVISRVVASVYYRVRYSGEPVPSTGPVLLVANHPNSLLDPTLVAAAARRPVRFLAKAPLFEDRRTGWLVRGAGAIPVYRRMDDPTRVDQNVDAFENVHSELARGSAVGIFPEGLSHSEPALAPLKTGAARMAFGAARLGGAAFPIVPVGLVFPRKEEFRSRAYVLIGSPVAWDDLAGHGERDAEAVRALTDRLSAAIHSVSVNLERWADQPLVDCAVRIWEAEHGATPTAAERVARLERTTELLAAIRAAQDTDGLRLTSDVDRFRRRLDRLRLRPADLGADVRARRGVRWAAGRLYLLIPPALAVAAIGFLAFYVPYRVTGWIVGRVRLEPAERSTWNVLVGIAVYVLWVLGIAAAWACVARRPLLAIAATVLGLPVIGMVGLVVRERWRGAWAEVRRFVLLRSRRAVVAQLRDQRRALGARLDALVARLGSSPGA